MSHKPIPYHSRTVAQITTTATPKEAEDLETLVMVSALTIVVLEPDVERRSKREEEEDATGDPTRTKRERMKDPSMTTDPLLRRTLLLLPRRVLLPLLLLWSLNPSPSLRIPP